MKIKKNDNVIVITGKDKGTKGKVLKVFPNSEKVVVDGVNIARKHISYKSDKKGEVIEKPMPVHVSNVAIIDPKDNKSTRVAYKVEGEKKIRIAKRSGQKI
jgi:large subunit ribosomal protein L24